MGEASRRKDLVDDVRKKIGEQAAQAVGELAKQVAQLQLQHRAFVLEVEGLRREVSAAKAAPAELRRDVISFRGDLAMKAEQIENLGLQVSELHRVYGAKVSYVDLGSFKADVLSELHELELRLRMPKDDRQAPPPPPRTWVQRLRGGW